MTDVDVVVIGAGAAGIGAAHTLQSAGKTYVILEAADRVGGRAYTDRSNPAVPWDQGCHWLHCADVNPLVAWADRLGAQYLKQDRDGQYRYWLGADWLDQAAGQACTEAIDTAFDRVYEASQTGLDVPVSDVLPEAGPYQGFVRHILQLMASEDPELESASGYGDYEDTETNWPMVSGYGDLIERMAEGLPIRLGVAATSVSDRPGGVTVETPEGTITARAAIVTVSTNVLASGAIRFDTSDVQPVLDTVAHLPCGSYEKVAMTLKRPLPGMEDVLFFSVEPKGQTPVNIQMLDWTDTMAIAHIGGSTARDAARDGPEGLRAYVAERMQLAFGRDILSEIAQMVTTGWQDNPLVRGAYSAVRPGYAQARRDLIGRHTGRVGFAGEAFSLRWQATAHGAYQSGQDVAARMIREEL